VCVTRACAARTVEWVSQGVEFPTNGAPGASSSGMRFGAGAFDHSSMTSSARGADFSGRGTQRTGTHTHTDSNGTPTRQRAPSPGAYGILGRGGLPGIYMWLPGIYMWCFPAALFVAFPVPITGLHCISLVSSALWSRGRAREGRRVSRGLTTWGLWRHMCDRVVSCVIRCACLWYPPLLSHEIVTAVDYTC
jgi:hypothetical protein